MTESNIETIQFPIEPGHEKKTLDFYLHRIEYLAKLQKKLEKQFEQYPFEISLIKIAGFEAYRGLKATVNVIEKPKNLRSTSSGRKFAEEAFEYFGIKVNKGNPSIDSCINDIK
ncbi:MAG: hypothetical protein Q7R97_00460 [Candidatus Daviesbacteria bacterium]|nr:hypothetical protein [Candidatus Daviesbacteria bacterium]